MISHILISRICVGLWSVCCRFVIGLSSGLSVCCRLRFQHCANDRFSIGLMSVIYRSQIGRCHTESYPKWPRHEPDWFCGVFSNIVGGRQLANWLKNLQFLSVSCRFDLCDWGISLPLHAFLSEGWVSVRPSAKQSMSITSVQVFWGRSQLRPPMGLRVWTFFSQSSLHST